MGSSTQPAEPTRKISHSVILEKNVPCLSHSTTAASIRPSRASTNHGRGTRGVKLHIKLDEGMILREISMGIRSTVSTHAF